MPGPGGGGHGGGGGRGGFSGGSHGGGFGGHLGGGHHYGGGYGHVGGWYPRRHYHGGGCFGGIFQILFVPVILIWLVVGFLFSHTPTQGGSTYDEEKFQDYADAQYAAEFGASSAYEDNLLITVLIEDEDYYSYYYIAWIGDHIASEINNLMGANGTELGAAMNSCINQASYKYSLDSNLAQVMQTMTAEIEQLGLENAFSCSENHIQVESHLSNHTGLAMSEETVNAALADFTDATGIPAVIVVEDMDEVFGRTASTSSIVFCIIAVIAVILIVILAVNAARRRKEQEEDFRDNRNDRYRDYDN